MGDAEAISSACGMAEGGASVAGSDVGGIEALDESSTSIGCSSASALTTAATDAAAGAMVAVAPAVEEQLLLLLLLADCAANAANRMSRSALP